MESQCLAQGKRIILVLNKVDLVPKPIVKGWMDGKRLLDLKLSAIKRGSVLKKELPTVAFKASTQKQRANIGRSSAATASTAYGADELTAVLGGYRFNLYSICIYLTHQSQVAAVASKQASPPP